MPLVRTTSKMTKEESVAGEEGPVVVFEQDLDGLKNQIRTKIHRARCIQILGFIVVIGLDIADLLSDWLFYADISIAQQGLVYGLPDEGAVVALLVFSIVGSITFTVEAANIVKDVVTGKPWINADAMSAVIMWVEDVPQISISVAIAVCREDPISVFQLAKASVVIITIVVRFVFALVKYCSKNALQELKDNSKSSRLHVAFRVLVVLGIIINLAGACAVFVFTQTHRDPDGNLYIQTPDSIFHDRFNDDRYFKNVSIYFHHPHFDSNEQNASLANWIRLITINIVRDLPDKVVMFSYEFQHTPTELRMVLWENYEGSWKPAECYTFFKSNSTMIRGSSCRTLLTSSNSTTSSSSSKRSSIIFKFSFTPPDRIFRKLVFGDIKFNAKYSDNNGFCDFISAANITDNIEDGLGDSIDVTVHYYRTTVSEDNHVIVSGTGESRFYREADLVDIKDVWQTGWFQCETKGSIAPHIDFDIEPPCETS